MVYQTLVLIIPVLTYACETWTLLSAHRRRKTTRSFSHEMPTPDITKIRWQYNISNAVVTSLTCVKRQSMTMIILYNFHRWPATMVFLSWQPTIEFVYVYVLLLY